MRKSPVINNFTARLLTAQRSADSLLCVGLDVDVHKLPSHLPRNAEGVIEFSKWIIDATFDLACAFKPNLAFFEALGTGGFDVLKRVLEFIPDSALTIGDGKRGDIGNTADMYASALFDTMGFDAVTVNPYMGSDSVKPFLSRPEKGAFILVLTSNPGSRDFQKARAGNQPLYERVARAAKKWNTSGNVGLVVGATQPRELRRVRSVAPALPILLPGIGTQGGSLRDAVRHGCTNEGWGAVINASRSILYASSGPDFATKARSAAMKLRAEMSTFQHKFF